MHLFKQLFAALNKVSVKYLVAGGIAVNLYGIQRSTADVDLVLRLDEENVRKFMRVVKDLDLRPKVPVPLEDLQDAHKREQWIRDKGWAVFSLYDPRNPFFLLDIFVKEPFDFVEVYGSRRVFEFEETTIPVVPIAELIAMKEISDRPQDKADVFYLKKILEEWTGEN